MIGGLILIPWAILCATYLAFRKAARRGNVTMVRSAESLLQPYLAIWGLFWSTFIGKAFSHSGKLTQFSYKVSRHFWGRSLPIGHKLTSLGGWL